MGSFTTIKTEVKARLDNRTDIDSRLNIWINNAYFEILMKPQFSFYELDLEGTFTTVVGLQQYNITGFANFWFLLSLRDSEDEREIRKVSTKVLDRISWTSGPPTRYARFGNFVLLDPIPTDVRNILARYRRRTNDLTDTDSTIWGREWDELLIVLSTSKGFQALKQFDAAKEELMIYSTMVAERQDDPMQEDMDSEFGITVRLD